LSLLAGAEEPVHLAANYLPEYLYHSETRDHPRADKSSRLSTDNLKKSRSEF